MKRISPGVFQTHSPSKTSELGTLRIYNTNPEEGFFDTPRPALLRPKPISGKKVKIKVIPYNTETKSELLESKFSSLEVSQRSKSPELSFEGSDSEYELDDVKDRPRTPLGSGSFGEVCGFESKQLKSFAVKKSPRPGSPGDYDSNTDGQAFRNEYKQLKQMGRFCALYILYENEKEIGCRLIMERIFGLTLDNHLWEMTECDQLTGLEYSKLLYNSALELWVRYHKLDRIHGDIKSNNIMVGCTYTDRAIKLYYIDHGYSAEIGSLIDKISCTYTHPHHGKNYWPPERCNATKTIKQVIAHPAQDVFQFCTMWLYWLGRPHDKFMTTFYPHVKRILKQGLDLTPGKRPSMYKIMSTIDRSRKIFKPIQAETRPAVEVIPPKQVRFLATI